MVRVNSVSRYRTKHHGALNRVTVGRTDPHTTLFHWSAESIITIQCWRAMLCLVWYRETEFKRTIDSFAGRIYVSAGPPQVWRLGQRPAVHCGMSDQNCHVKSWDRGQSEINWSKVSWGSSLPRWSGVMADPQRDGGHGRGVQLPQGGRRYRRTDGTKDPWRIEADVRSEWVFFPGGNSRWRSHLFNLCPPSRLFDANGPSPVA